MARLSLTRLGSFFEIRRGQKYWQFNHPKFVHATVPSNVFRSSAILLVETAPAQQAVQQAGHFRGQGGTQTSL